MLIQLYPYASYPFILNEKLNIFSFITNINYKYSRSNTAYTKTDVKVLSY